jgi:hypothetical protein
VAPVRGASEIDAGITLLRREVGGTSTLAPDDSIFGHPKLIIELAAQYRLPTIYQLRAFAADGGLLS